MWLTVVSGPDAGLYKKLSEEVLLIGREVGRDEFLVSDTHTSRTHCTVKLKDAQCIIRDEGSTNKVLVNGHPLNPGEFKVLEPTDTVIIGRNTYRLLMYEPHEPEQSSRTHLLSNERIALGRDPSNDIVLDHPMVSRFHACLIKESGKTYLQDLNSTNGTYVNGNTVTGRVEVDRGAAIQICGFRFVYDGLTLNEYNENSGQVVIELKGLTKTVPEKKTTKTLLDDINLVIQPREFVAILGGSGAGKSTLLGAMSGLRPANGGQILINGRDFYNNYSMFKSMVGYVPQDDIVHSELTVEEVLRYSSKLRMPEDVSDEEIEKIVDDVLEKLELTKRRELLVKSLSGGQRKRVSIGVELLTRPSIFFLDEPTSGLDPGLEKSMMEMMRKLTDFGQTVFVVTHATFNINLCDKVIFLTEGGKLAFYGTPQEALEYFRAKDFAEIYQMISQKKTPKEWALTFLNHSNLRRENLQQLAYEIPTIEKQRIGLFRQWKTLTSRYVRILTRDINNLLLYILQPVVIGLIIVMTFLHSAPTFEPSEYNSADLVISDEVIMEGRVQEVLDLSTEETKRRGSMNSAIAFMIFASIWFGTSNAAREIVKENPIFRRERLVNLRLLPYLLSKVSVLTVISAIQVILFLLIITVGLGLPSFWLNYGAFLLISVASIMMGLTVSAVAVNSDQAITAVPLLLIPQIILSGAIIPMDNVSPKFFQHIFDLAISRWGYELVGGKICDINGLSALEEGIKAFEGDAWIRWFALSLFVVIFFLLSAFSLWRKDKKTG